MQNLESSISFNSTDLFMSKFEHNIYKETMIKSCNIMFARFKGKNFDKIKILDSNKDRTKFEN